jgi:hypothetical protein
MSPADSRSNANRNAVRLFTADKLNKAVQSEKWDRVKIVCTQPFNKVRHFFLFLNRYKVRYKTENAHRKYFCLFFFHLSISAMSVERGWRYSNPQYCF